MMDIYHPLVSLLVLFVGLIFNNVSFIVISRLRETNALFKFEVFVPISWFLIQVLLVYSGAKLAQDHGYLSVARLIDSLIYFLCFQQRREGSGEVQKADMS